MATRYFIRNVASCLFREGPKKTIKPLQDISLIHRHLTACSVDIHEKSNHLVIRWQDNLADEYPLVWLRDNCQCSSCFDVSSQSRTINFSHFQVNQQCSSSVISNSTIDLQWEDGHKSSYDFKWLRKRSFNEEKQRKWLNSNKTPYKTWISEDFKKIPVLDFRAVIKDDCILLEWLQILDTWGVCVIDNVPNSLGHVGTLAKRVAFVKKTHYGEEYSVQAKADATNVAYTQGYLPLHTDLPYYEYKPGINLLHCFIQYQGDGGDSLLSDGFVIAEWLRKNDPESYRCLTETNVTWSDIGQENGNHFHKIHHAPVICESSDGTIRRINYSQPQRDSHMAVNIDQVENWYRALKKFYELATDPRYLVEFKLKPGQMVTFDNIRILHGRTSFGQTLKGDRHVQGAYLDWDEARSRMRVLKAKLFSEES